MTYQELLVHIMAMTPEQRKLNVVINDSQREEFYPALYLMYNVKSDIIDNGNPVLVINK